MAHPNDPDNSQSFLQTIQQLDAIVYDPSILSRDCQQELLNLQSFVQSHPDLLKLRGPAMISDFIDNFTATNSMVPYSSQLKSQF